MLVSLPKAYKWLEKEKSPRILMEALKLYGTKEIPGRKHNQTIIDWAKEIGPPIDKWYDADEKAWCALAMSICAKRAGYKPPLSWSAIRAMGFQYFGRNIEKGDYAVGDLAIFNRKGGGHIGLLVGYDHEAYHILGGNQANSFNITRIKRDRLYLVRRCPYKTLIPKPLPALQLNGVLSTDEA